MPILKTRLDALRTRYSDEDLAGKLEISLSTFYRWRHEPPKRLRPSVVRTLDRLEKSMTGKKK